MTQPSVDLTQHILRPTVGELCETKVLFFYRHATDTSDEMVREHGYSVTATRILLYVFETFKMNITPASDNEVLFGPLDYDFILHFQLGGALVGKEMLVPAIAAMRGIPYFGAPAPIRALSEDKILGKAMAASLGLNVAQHHLIHPRAPSLADFRLPGTWVMKPRNGVMSRDVSFIDDEASWRAALADAVDPKHEGREFIVEEFVPGLNLTVPVIEGFPLQGFPVFVEHGEARNNILTAGGKDGSTADYGSDPYEGPGAAQASAAAARLAQAIAPFDYARFDFRYDPASDRLVFLEFNICCMLGPHGVVARAADLRGVDYGSLIGHLFTHSLRRQRMEL